MEKHHVATPCLLDGDHQIFVGNMTVDKWLPGEIELFNEEYFKQPTDLPPGEVVNVADSIDLPDDVPSGAYKLSVAVVVRGSHRTGGADWNRGSIQGWLVSVEHVGHLSMNRKGRDI